jgi:molybdopterin molybdotransferase
LRVADISSVPAKLRVIGSVRAGEMWPASSAAVAAGECVEIMTGAPLPPGADAVVMVEDTSLAGDGYVDVKRTVSAGANFVPRGSEAHAGDIVLERGSRVGYKECAIAAMVGAAELRVFRKPRVAILSTGDEVVEVSATPGPAQIRNSNAWSLAQQVADACGEPVILPIAPDEPKRLRELIEKGLNSDLLLLSGGVSMGKHDLVEPVLKELNAEFHFTGAKIQPGKPVVFGEARKNGVKKPFFGLPGNPVSTMVTFDLFVRPVVDELCGAKVAPLKFAQAVLKSDVKVRKGLTRFLPAVLSGGPERPEVELVEWGGSGDVFSMAGTNCYLVTSPESENLPAHSLVTILLR